MQIDWEYLIRSMARLSGIPVRAYRKGTELCRGFPVELPRDPLEVCREEVFAVSVVSLQE